MLNIQSFNMPSIIFYLGDTTQHFFHSGRTVLKKVITSLSYIILNTIVITTTLSAQNINTQENLLSNTDFYALNQKETSSLINDSVISVIGQWSYGPCYANVVQGSYDYIANGQMLQVVDISNPANPVAVGELLTGRLVSRLQVAGNYAYTISPFRIIDISNPAYPELIKTFLLPEGYPPTAVTVDGNYAYVGDFYGFIFIIDISDPTDPIVIGQMLTFGERVQNIIIRDTLLYATTSDGAAIDIFNISNLSSPFYISQVAAGLAGSPLAINGNYLFYGTGELLRIYDISDPLKPLYIKGINLGSIIYVISVINNTAFVTLGDGGLTSIDLTDSNDIHILTNLKNPYGFENDLGIGGPLGESLNTQYAYLSTGTGLWIVDISNANQLNSISFFPTGLPPVNITVDSSGYAYIAELYAGMKIVDFTNAASPKLVSEYSPKESVRDVAIGQNEAYLLCDSDLIVLDISNHKAPRFLSKIAFEDTLNDNNGVFAYGRLMLSDSILYVGRNSNKLYIVNVKDPSHPKIDSYLATREATVDIAQYGKYVYIAEADAGILIIDISNSKNIIDSIFISISPLRGMCISDNKLLLADAGPFSVYDITDPIDPKFKYKLHLPGGTVNAEIKVDQDFAYVSTNASFNVLNISNPDSGKIEFTKNNTEFGIPLFGLVAVSNGNILLGADYFGVIILKNVLITSVETPAIRSASFELFQNFPNPFNPTTGITYVVNKESFVTLKIYDLLGREISTLINEKKSIGTYLINFNASNLSSGIYFYSINAGNFHQTRKMILIK